MGVSVIAQNSENSWTLNFDKAPDWLSVDKRTDIIYYYNNTTLKAYDYKSDKELWTLPVADYKGSKFVYYDASTLLKINDTKAFTVKSNKSIVINRFSGDVVFRATDVEAFNNSKILYSRDENYAVLLNKEVIKKDKEKGTKRKVNWYLTLVKMHNSEALWTIKLPKKELGILGDDFLFGVVCTNNTLLFTYDSNLLAYNINNGELKWKKNLKENKIKYIKIPKNNEGFLSISEIRGQGFFMNYSEIDSGKDLWAEPFPLGRYYAVNFAPNQIIVKCANGFNYLGYDKSKYWPENVPVKGKIEKVYAQGDDHLIINKVDGKYFANWINKEGEYAFKTPISVLSNKLIEGVKMDDYILLITPYNIIGYDLRNQEITSKTAIKNKRIYYTINKASKSLVFKHVKKETPLILKQNASKPENFIKKVPFTKGNDTITRIENFNDTYSFISRNEVVKLDNTGQEISRLFYKPPSKALKTLAKIGAMALGTVFAKEAGQINRELYRAGLKDMDDFASEFTTVYYFKEFGSAELGMGMVAGATVNDMINSFEKKTKYNPYNEINKLWMHRDKLDDGSWGLRIVDIENIKELHQFSIGKDKNFNYRVDADSKIIISSTDKEIKFFRY